MRYCWKFNTFIQLFGFLMLLEETQASRRSTEYIVNGKGSMVLELVFDSKAEQRHILGCTVLDSRGSISKKIPKMRYENTHVMNEKSLNMAAKACEHISSSKKGKDHDDSFTFPGTKWCGPGNTAKNFNDLGPHLQADSCCRMHDFCPQTIAPGKTNFGLTNPSPGIISHCDCDERLSKCLRGNRDRVSDIIGIMFFDMLQMQCFRNENSKAKCNTTNGLNSRSCQHRQGNSTEYRFYSAQPYKHAHNH